MKNSWFIIFIFVHFFSISQENIRLDTVKLYLKKATNYYQKEQLDSSIFWAQEAMLFASRHQEKHDLIYSTLLVAQNFKAKKDYILSLEYYLKALQTSNFIEDPSLQQLIYFETGELYSDWKIYEKAIEYYQYGLSLNQNTAIYAKILEKIAIHNTLLQEYKQAIYYYEKLEKIQLPHQKSHTLDIIAQLLQMEGDYNHALYFKKQALKLQGKGEESDFKTKLYNDIGALYTQLEQYENARLYFEHSLILAKNQQNEEALLYNYIDLGLLYDKKQEYLKAIKILQKAVTYQKKKGTNLELASTYNYIAKIYVSLGDVKAAKKYLDSARFLTEKLPASRVLESTYQLYVSMFKASRKKQVLKQYESKVEQIRKELNQQEKERLYKERLQLTVIQKAEKQIQDLLRYQQITELEYYTLDLEHQSREKEFELLQKQKKLEQLNLEKEIILKQKVKKDLLLTQKELESIKKINLIEQLQHNHQIQSLHIERQKLLEKKNKSKLDSLEQQKKLDEFSLINKESQLASQKHTQNLIILSFFLALLFFVIITILVFYRHNTKELKLIQEKTQIEHRLFRSQMNPHFLFNAMNSIQSFIMNEDSLSAHSYLAKFASLMRLILDNSSEEFIPLEQEIMTLQLYLELERLRFDNKFDFVIDIDENVDEEFVGIPPMLIQPFIENAILHGLIKKDSGGVLSVILREEGDRLYCCIKDNGIGREKAKELSQKHFKTHKSRAIELTEKRLEIFQKQYSQETSITFKDLYHNDQTAAGTQVELYIPIKEI